MKKTLWLFIVFFMIQLSQSTKAQVTNTGTLDTNSLNIKGKVTISGYVDAYYGYDFSNPASKNRVYSVSSNRTNEFNINLAYIDAKYSTSAIRARVVAGFGTYVNSNYTNEPLSLKNIIEASVGLKLFKTKDIWLDVGVFGSPYTNESAISKDHLMYTRSFAPEYVPYYLSGAKLTLPVGKKIIAYLYAINGWQVIADNNNELALGTQVEYRPNDKLLINWDIYAGSEQSTASPNSRNRYFTDIYAIFNPNGKFSFTSCAYIGVQEKVDTLNNNTINNDVWWQANFIARYKFTDKVSLSGRVEYFEDLKSVQITPINNLTGGFASSSVGLCLNINAAENVLVRFEGRNFFSDRNMYQDDKGNPTSSNILLVSNLTIWF